MVKSLEVPAISPLIIPGTNAFLPELDVYQGQQMIVGIVRPVIHVSLALHEILVPCFLKLQPPSEGRY